MHPKKPLDFNYITDGIYIGTNRCCQMHFDERLAQEGVSIDMSLEENQLDAPFGVEFYVWIPVVNHKAPTYDQLMFGVSALEKIVAMKKKVYVHCKNGHGRAPTMVAAYLIYGSKSVKDAVAFLKSKRPSVHLSDAQQEALERYAREYMRNMDKR